MFFGSFLANNRKPIGTDLFFPLFKVGFPIRWCWVTQVCMWTSVLVIDSHRVLHTCEEETDNHSLKIRAKVQLQSKWEHKLCTNDGGGSQEADLRLPSFALFNMFGVSSSGLYSLIHLDGTGVGIGNSLGLIGLGSGARRFLLCFFPLTLAWAFKWWKLQFYPRQGGWGHHCR